MSSLYYIHEEFGSDSTADTKAPKDEFQDYDVVYVVDDLDNLTNDLSWLDQFGKRIIEQEVALDHRRLYLMLFEDGNRIDLTLCPKDHIQEWVDSEADFTVLNDPQGLFVPYAPTPKRYWTAPASATDFDKSCNEFWWVSTYVVKGLCRNELFYAVTHLYEYCQQELLRLLSWQAAWQEPEPISVGKQFKYLKNYVTPDTMDQLASLLDFSSKEACWNSLIKTQAFFDVVAQDFAKMAQFTYHLQEAKKVTEYTNSLRLKDLQGK